MRNLSSEVLADLAAAVCEGHSLHLVGKLDRARYQAVDKVIRAAGGKWNRRERCHVFDGDAREAVEQVVLTGGIGPKQELGQFDSPPAVVDRVMELAQISFGMRVLEPSAGLGALAIAAIRAGGIVHTYEIDPARCEKLNQSVAALSGEAARASTGRVGDFLVLRKTYPPIFDRVVMNPPFARQADIIHVRAAAEMVCRGGRLVAVMSAGVTFREDARTREFRHWLQFRGGSIELLPPDSFKSSGTSVSACIVSVDIP